MRLRLHLFRRSTLYLTFPQTITFPRCWIKFWKIALVLLYFLVAHEANVWSSSVWARRFVSLLHSKEALYLGCKQYALSKPAGHCELGLSAAVLTWITSRTPVRQCCHPHQLPIKRRFGEVALLLKRLFSLVACEVSTRGTVCYLWLSLRGSTARHQSVPDSVVTHTSCQTFLLLLLSSGF
jgi:hypothetical protein